MMKSKFPKKANKNNKKKWAEFHSTLLTTISESLRFINRARWEVSTSPIVNCWRKADIIKNISNNDIVLNNEISREI